MNLKRRRVDDGAEAASRPLFTKKLRRSATGASYDRLSPLSDELLVRILSCLSLSHLLSVAPVSKRFNRLSEDSQLWKHLYYSRFVLPRALRIPGFRDGSAREGKVHYSARRAVWADGRRGGWVDMHSNGGDRITRNWKRQYKLRHNWSRGKCAVEEVNVEEGRDPPTEWAEPQKMLVKVCEGIAVTADATSGLRAWDLKTKQLVAHIGLAGTDTNVPPSCLAIDDQKLAQETIDIAVGFCDGSFGVWKLDIRNRRLLRRYRHEKSINGALAGAAFSFPYLLTATDSVLISLYTFEKSYGAMKQADCETEKGTDTDTARQSESQIGEEQRSRSRLSRNLKTPAKVFEDVNLPSPYLLTSLKSHTSRAPLALSIRKTVGSTIASIAYTFSTLQGWSLGIQDLHVKPALTSSNNTPDITTTRLAYTIPVTTTPSYGPSPPVSPSSPYAAASSRASEIVKDGPMSICYTHPYLLATLPDNTLILYLCTSSASSLSISPGIRLWGHTSGISDAEITARGKAVSVSSRGEEIRVWELEGRADGRSIEVRPTVPESSESSDNIFKNLQPDFTFDDRRNWVGFDDEMVIVLKESRGRESLMVYDFT